MGTRALLCQRSRRIVELSVCPAASHYIDPWHERKLGNRMKIIESMKTSFIISRQAFHSCWGRALLPRRHDPRSHGFPQSCRAPKRSPAAACARRRTRTSQTDRRPRTAPASGDLGSCPSEFETERFRSGTTVRRCGILVYVSIVRGQGILL